MDIVAMLRDHLPEDVWAEEAGACIRLHVKRAGCAYIMRTTLASAPCPVGYALHFLENRMSYRGRRSCEQPRDGS